MSSGWRTLLLRIGDRCPEYGSSADHKEHIETCYGSLSREYEHSKDTIFEFLLQCAEQLPHKIPFFGVLIGLINLENEDFAKAIVDATQANLQDALHNGNHDRIRILLRFLSSLMCSKVVAPSSIVEAFETLVSSAATILDEETGNPSWQPRADFYVYCILASLPWGGQELLEILRNAVSKTYNRISDLRKEIQSLKRGLQVAKEISAKAIKELEEAKSVLEIVERQPAGAEKPGKLRRLQVHADKAKQEEITTEEALEAKGALLVRVLEESKELLKLLFKKFVDVLTERLPSVSADGEIPNLRAGDLNVNFAAHDPETATMEIDNENGADNNSDPNEQNTKNGYNVGELEQWCLCTLGYLKSFSRQYASEIWSHIAMLDEEVFVGDVHPLIRKAAFSGLCRFSS